MLMQAAEDGAPVMFAEIAMRPSDYEHFETIRHVRNVFAHGTNNSLSFDHPDVAGDIASLIRPDQDWFQSITSMFTDKEVMLGPVFG